MEAHFCVFTCWGEKLAEAGLRLSSAPSPKTVYGVCVIDWGDDMIGVCQGVMVMVTV